jgi:putative copper resistance protein D
MNLILHIIPSWLELVFLAYGTGTLACCLWVFPISGNAGQPEQGQLIGRVWLFLAISIALTLASGSVNLLVRTAEMSVSPLWEAFPALPAVVLKTHFGGVWLIRIAGLVLVLAIVWAGRAYRNSRPALYLLLGIGAIVAMTESASGHAADAGDFSLNEIVDWLHLFAASVWGGGLFVMSTAVLPLLAREGAEGARSIAGVAARFSRIAGIAVGTIILTALYNAWIYAGSIDAFLKTPYGRIIIAKIALFIALLILAAYNRYVRVPRLLALANMPAPRRSVPGGLLAPLLAPFVRDAAGDADAVRFARSVRVEALLMIGVFFCAALLRHEVPAKHFLHLEHAGVMHADHGRLHHAVPGAEPVIHLKTDPATLIAGTPAMLTVSIEDGNGRPLQGLAVHHDRILHVVIISEDLNIFAHIHPEDIGPITTAMVKKATFPVRYVFPKAGRYLIGFDFAASDALYSKQVVLTVSGGPRMGRQKVDLSRSKDFGHYRVTLSTPPEGIKVGEETALVYRIEKDGKPVTDLQPYLGAPMHLSVVRADLAQFMHIHGVLPGETHTHDDHMHAMPPERFGPKIEADVVFPDKGVYKIFSQVQHQGKVLLFDFMVEVR